MRELLALGAIIGALAACGGKGDTGTDEVTFTQVRDDVLLKSCGLSTCHKPNADPALWASESELVMDPDDPDAIYDAIVNATAATGKTLIVPNDVDGSFLITKSKAEQEPTEGDPMPPPFGLPAEDIDLLVAWVNAGAPND